MANDIVTPNLVAFLFSDNPKRGKDRGGSFKLLCERLQQGGN